MHSPVTQRIGSGQIRPVRYAAGRSRKVRLSINIFTSMTTLVKIHRKGQMTLPSSFRTAMGVGEGSLVELSLKKGKTVITPKVVIDRSAFPSADDEYTPAQRRIIDARLDRSEEALKKGRGYGLFNTAEEMIADMKARMRKRSAVKKVTRPR